VNSLKHKLQEYIKNPSPELDLSEHSPEDVLDMFETIGGELTDDLETNGWEWYWNMPGTFNDQTFRISGCGWTSRVTIALEDDD